MMKKWAVYTAILLMGGALWAYPPRGGSATKTRPEIPDCSAITGACPSSNYTCVSSDVIYRCVNPNTWTALSGSGHTDGANCLANQYPLGVDEDGVVQSCTADDDTPDNDAEVPDDITVTSSGTVTGETGITVGSGADEDECFTFDLDATNDIRICWDESASAIEFDFDGTLGDGADVTVGTASITVPASTNPIVEFTDSDDGTDPDDVSGSIDVNLDVATVDVQDATMTLKVMENGSLVNALALAGDSTITSALPVVRTHQFSMYEIEDDGTQCTRPNTETPVASGPEMEIKTCADNDAGTLIGHMRLPDGYEAASTFVFHMQVYDVTASPANDYEADMAVMCRGTGDAINSTWGTEVALDIDTDTDCSGACAQYEIITGTTGAVTGNGPCAAGDELFWRFQIDATGTDVATATNIRIIGFSMEYQWNFGD